MRKVFITCFIVYTFIVSYLSLTPIDSELDFTLWDKAAHTIAYLGFSLLSYLVVRGHHQFLILLMTCFLYGVAIELLQGLTSYRMASWLDQVANTVGLLIGYLVSVVLAYLCPSFQGKIWRD